MQSIFDFIATQPEIMVNKIYGSSDPDNQSSPWACKAIFSSLSALSKNYVFRCLLIHEPLTTADIEKWVKPELKHLHLIAVDELIKLRILLEVYSEEATVQKLQMNSHFRRGFQYTLCNPIEPWCNTAAHSVLKGDKKAPSREELDEHCGEKWNDVLRCILNIPLPNAAGDSTIENFLKCTGLVIESSKRNHEITSDGYEYLLKDHQSQVWIFVLQSLSRAQNQEEALVLFFLLSDCKFGNCYPIEALSKSQKQLVFEFSKIGLIYMRSILSTRFYPTRAAINMLFKSSRNEGEQAPKSGSESNSSSSSSSIPGALRSRGKAHVLQIIVETNLQVIAYVTSDLHLAMLKLFVDLAVRMPNMAIGKITRERSKEAFRMGIRASQIIEFLLSHAHPKTAIREASVVPDNVCDQLLLWEAERYRVQADEVVLLDFLEVRGMTRALFTNIFTYAKKLNVCLWGNEVKMVLAVQPEAREHVQAYAEDLLGFLKNTGVGNSEHRS